MNSIAMPLRCASLGNRQTDVHQDGLAGGYVVDGENLPPHFFRRIVDLYGGLNHLGSWMLEVGMFNLVTRKNQSRAYEKQNACSCSLLSRSV